MLTESPVVASDDVVVLVDLTVRFTAAAGDDRPASEWDPHAEDAVHAVILTAVRLLGDDHRADDLLVGRALLDEAVRRHLSRAPVPIGFEVATTTAEVRRHGDRDARGPLLNHEFRALPRV